MTSPCRTVIAPTYGSPDVLALVNMMLADPEAGEVQIVVRAAAVNPADVKRVAGMFGIDGTALPLRLGTEVAGVVTAIGTAIEDFVIGDEVVAFPVVGGYSSFVNAPAASVFRKPKGLGWEEAAGLLGAFTTAAHLVAATGVADGDRVIVHGASGAVGLAAVQLAVARGASVVGTGSPLNHDLIRRAGATPIAYGVGLESRLRAELPDGADAAIDTAGTDEALDASVALVSDRLRIATIVGYRRGAELGVKRLGFVPDGDPGVELRSSVRAELVRMADLGVIHVNVIQKFGLEEAAAALDLVATRHAGGKVVLVP